MTCFGCNGTGTIDTTVEGTIYTEPCNCEAGEGQEYSERRETYPCPTCDATLRIGEECPECAGSQEMTAEEFGRAIQPYFPEMVEQAFKGEQYQNGDEELAIFNGYGFRVLLAGGQQFDIVISKR